MRMDPKGNRGSACQTERQDLVLAGRKGASLGVELLCVLPISIRRIAYLPIVERPHVP